MTEDDLEYMDSNNGCPVLECVVFLLGFLEVVSFAAITWWLWG